MRLCTRRLDSEEADWHQKVWMPCLDVMVSCDFSSNLRHRLKRSYKQYVLAHSRKSHQLFHQQFSGLSSTLFSKQKLGSHIKLWCLRHSFKAMRYTLGKASLWKYSYCYQTTSFHMVLYTRYYDNSWIRFGCFEVTQHSVDEQQSFLQVSSPSLGLSIMSGRASGLSEPAGASSDRGLANWEVNWKSVVPFGSFAWFIAFHTIPA